MNDLGSGTDGVTGSGDAVAPWAPTVHAFVISWSDRADAARAIAAALEGHVDRLTVIHSERGGTPQAGPGDWINVSDTHFYGMKFRRSLEQFSGDLMLQIQADAACEDWAGLVAAVRQCFGENPDVGIWAPDVGFTPLPLRLTSLAEEPSGRHQVVIVDGIVWALAASVCDRLREFDYTRNNVGWGIDWAAACFALATGRSMLVDPHISVAHPVSRGYRTDSAERQMDAFLSVLSPRERAMRELIRSQLAPKRGDHPLREGLHLAYRDRRHRARLALDRLMGRSTLEPAVAVPVPVLVDEEWDAVAARTDGDRS